MAEDDRYCLEVVTHVAAITKAWQSVSVGLSDDHPRHCVAEAVAAGGLDAERKLTEATAAVRRPLTS
jgi:DNA-binding FrmR family transcriptional regulator